MPAFPSMEPEKPKKPTYRTWILVGICAAVAVFSLVKLIGYFGEAARSRETSRELRDAYHEAAEEGAAVTAEPEGGENAVTEPEEEVAEAPEQAPAETETESGTVTETEAPATPAGKAAGTGWVSSYPDNPWLKKSERVVKLQKTNKDIIGWVGIEGVVDEAVVQRDNSWYLTHDYKNNKNANGALFLDESCPMLDRPPVYIIYGHNMKTGAMLGNLRKWDDAAWYHNHPVIHLETLYEEGDYIIFAAGVAGETEIAKGLMVYYSSDPKNEMKTLIAAMEQHSAYMKQIEVTEEDQLLILVTCTGDERERRFLAARKVRGDETTGDMAKKVGMSWKK